MVTFRAIMGSRQAAVLAWALLLSCEMGSTKTPISERTPPVRTDDAADVEEQTGNSEILSEFQREYDTSLTHPRAVFEKYLPRLGAATLLDFLERRYPGCHAQSHELGQAIFSMTRDVETALKRCDTRCTSGCMHGVVTAAFGDATFGAVLARMDEFCPRGEMAAIHQPGNCAHGLGHALMFVTHGNEQRSSRGMSRILARSDAVLLRDRRLYGAIYPRLGVEAVVRLSPGSMRQGGLVPWRVLPVQGSRAVAHGGWSR